MDHSKRTESETLKRGKATEIAPSKKQKVSSKIQECITARDTVEGKLLKWVIKDSELAEELDVFLAKAQKVQKKKTLYRQKLDVTRKEYDDCLAAMLQGSFSYF